jgi:hypothetical protein
MCECGCANIIGHLRFPAPDGDVYILDFYPGCRDCDTAAGITIYRFTPAETEEWHVTDAKPVNVDNTGFPLSVVSPRLLSDAMTKWLGSNDDYDAEGAIQDGIAECFYDAARKTFDEWESWPGKDVT